MFSNTNLYIAVVIQDKHPIVIQDNHPIYKRKTSRPIN